MAKDLNNARNLINHMKDEKAKMCSLLGKGSIEYCSNKISFSLLITILESNKTDISALLQHCQWSTNLIRDISTKLLFSKIVEFEKNSFFFGNDPFKDR